MYQWFIFHVTDLRWRVGTLFIPSPFWHDIFSLPIHPATHKFSPSLVTCRSPPSNYEKGEGIHFLFPVFYDITQPPHIFSPSIHFSLFFFILSIFYLVWLDFCHILFFLLISLNHLAIFLPRFIFLSFFFISSIFFLIWFDSIFLTFFSLFLFQPVLVSIKKCIYYYFFSSSSCFHCT